MGKVKSAICLTLITLLIAVLCVVCFVPFPLGSDGISYYNPIVNWTRKSWDIGGYLYGEDAAYAGGGYTVVYYPDGVISKADYESNLADKSEEEQQEYEDRYVSYANGAIYLDKEEVCGDGETPTETFKSDFEKNVRLLEARYERLRTQGMKLEVVDDYTVRASLPTTMGAFNAAFLYFSYTGKVSVRYGSDSSSATVIFPLEGKREKPITEYLERASLRSANGTAYVGVRFTKEGQALVAEATSGASDSSSTLFIMVGDVTVINLSVTEQIDQRELFVSGSYSLDSASVIASVLDTAIDFEPDGALKMEMGEIYRVPAAFGDNSLSFLYIAFGVCFAAMTLYFLIRYRRLGFAHIYSYLIYLIAMVLVIWAIPIAVGMGTILAFLLGSVLLSVSNAVSYEYVRKEFATGKTMASSVKAGYKRCFWHLFDLHIVLLAVGLLTYLIALSELSAFGLVLTLAALASGICTLAINRFMWYIMMPFAKNAGQFCHFKREEVEDE